MYDKKIGHNFVPITQTEVVKELNSNKVTINQIFKELKSLEYVIQDENKLGRYYLTDKALTLVEDFRRADKNKV